MKKYVWLIIGGIPVVILVFLIIAFSGGENLSTTCTITVRDAVSKSWVYNSTIRLQDRVIRGFKSTSFTFKNIKTGKHLISVSAPNYQSKEMEVILRTGKNIIPDPIDLVGYAIPNLSSISIFEKKQEDIIFLDIRLVGKDGHAIANHPCVPIRVIVNISVQLVNGEYDVYKEGMDITRGKLLYSGSAEWRWNTGLNQTYRYSAHLPLDVITASPAPYWIVAYLILLPDPTKITPEQVDTIVQKVYTMDDPEALNQYLAEFSDSIPYYLSIKPNIENLLGGGQ